MKINFGVLVSVTFLFLQTSSVIAKQDSSVIATSSTVDVQKNIISQEDLDKSDLEWLKEK